MVHQRARNLPAKGIVTEWLFKNDAIAFGEDFARVRLEDGSDFVVKSNYNGIIVRTIKLDSPIKNGSILANILVGEKEIIKYKNRSLIKGEEEVVNEEYLSEEFTKNVQNEFTELDSDEFVAEQKNQQNSAQTVTESESERSVEVNTNMDRFAQMRANIKKSIANAPQIKDQSNISQDELLKTNNSDVIKSGGAEALFASQGAGPSKFRQLINARKEALHQENNFKEVEEAAEVNAMTKTDEKGRPLIMRNIVAARMEKLNNAGGDVNVLKNETNNSLEMKGGNDMAITNNDMSGFANEPKSRSQAFGDQEHLEVSTYRGTVMPGKDPNQLMNEIQGKQNKTYAEAKLTNLYDANRRSSIVANGNERNIILQRKQAVEAGMGETLQTGGNAFWKGNLPKKFSTIVPQQSVNGEIQYLRYDQTAAGKRELEDWRAKNKNGQASFGEQDTNLTYPSGAQQHGDNLDLAQEWEIPNQTPKQIQKELDNKLHEQEKELKAVAGKAVADETIDLLKKQIADLQVNLEKQNQLNAATQRLNAAPTFGGNFAGGTDTFSQLFQYMMMQNIMQNMPTNNNKASADDVKDIIRREIDNFKNDISPWRQHHNFGMLPCGCYAPQMPNNNMMMPFNHQCGYYQGQNFSQPMPMMPQAPMMPTNPMMQPYQNQNNFNNLKPVNFEELRDNNFAQNNFVDQNSYIEFEGQDENKIVERKKVNKNRNSAVKSMILSQNYIPPLTISTEIDMSSILKLKHVLKKTQDEVKFPSIAFIVKAISITLEEHPKLNSSYDPESNEVVTKKYHNVGLATETSEGLIIPVLKFVEKLSVKEVAIDIKEMTKRLRSGQLFNYETEGSTITIANYGSVGAIQATPTIFYPNAAVIGVGKVIKKPVVVSDEKIAIKAIMNMTLTVDQRIIDAAEAGQFLARIKEILERPELLTVS